MVKTNGVVNTMDYCGAFVYRNGKLEFIRTAEGYASVVTGGYRYVYEYKDHLGSNRLSYTDANGDGKVSKDEIITEMNYYPFGLEHRGYNIEVRSTGNLTAQRYKYNGKEYFEDLGLDWYDYGARNYEASLGRWVNVDPLAAKFPWQSPFMAFDGNPINKIDPTGMSTDWFQNELTGDVYYDSEMREGDEGTGAMTGEGWVHMGENGMFSDGSPITSDALTLFGNQRLGKVSMTQNYDKSFVYADAKVISVTMAGMFKGDNANKLMSGLGYDFKPLLFKYYSDVTTEYHPEPHGQVTLTHDNSKVESVLSSRYISQDLVLKKTLTLGNYEDPDDGTPKNFGPVYSIRNQSWTIRQNVYGTSAFGRKAGKIINWLEKNSSVEGCL